MPSGHAATLAASYAILRMLAVVFVDPTGPTMKLANLSDQMYGSVDGAGLKSSCTVSQVLVDDQRSEFQVGRCLRQGRRSFVVDDEGFLVMPRRGATEVEVDRSPLAGGDESSVCLRVQVAGLQGGIREVKEHLGRRIRVCGEPLMQYFHRVHTQGTEVLAYIGHRVDFWQGFELHDRFVAEWEGAGQCKASFLGAGKFYYVNVICKVVILEVCI